MKIVIAAARRTPIGSFLGAFADVSAVTLGRTAAQEVLRGVDCKDVADVIVGNVLQAGQGMNPARQIALGSGLPVTVPGQTINRVCGSGMQAVVSAVQAIRAGNGKLYLAGGVESMSRAPFLVQQMRRGQKLGDVGMIDSMVNDGLTDPTHRYHMGITAENVAAQYGLSREAQDAFALESHRRATVAQSSGVFDAEIVPVSVASRKGPVVTTRDEAVRPDTSLEALAKLKPAFKPDGTVTAGNASGLNDGAAMLLVCDAEYAQAHGLEPLAEIVSYACVGVDPALMGLGPSSAVPVALGRAGLSLAEIDLFELNEAFASQSLAVCRDLKLPEDRVNVSGGAIALGHPIGASGARVLVTLAHALRMRRKTHGVASLCIGGGMGIAMVLRHADAR
jgi:acetyl-CoA C-acetyltransferase